MKRVVIFSTAYFPLVGGAEVALREITDRIQDIEFHLITAHILPGLTKQEVMGNVIVHRVGFGMAFDKYLLPLLGLWKALRLNNEKPIDVIWSLMASYNGFAALFYTWCKPQTPMLLTLQEGDPLEYIQKRVGILSPLFKRIFQRAHTVQAISHFLAEWAKMMGFQGEPFVIPNGVDVDRFTKSISDEQKRTLRESWGVGMSDVLIVTASRLVKKNATDDLVRALTLLPPMYHVVVAGAGEDKNMLDELIITLGIQHRVHFLGTVGHADLPGVLQACDIFCRPSRSEGLGNSFLEAMACGLPTIGTPVGGIPDFLVEGKTGFLCHPNDPQSIADAVLRIQSDMGKTAQIVLQGQTVATTQYRWDDISLRIRELFQRM